MDIYRKLLCSAFDEYLDRCRVLYASRKTHKSLLSMTHFHMINISYEMLMDGLY